MHNLDYRKFTLARIDAFIKQIQQLKELHSPYSDTSKALNIIAKHISTQRKDVEKTIFESDALKSLCARATSELFNYQRILGYIAKSADPINSFEIYFSFRRIAESILGKNMGLIISSEWEYYSPVNFIIPTKLNNFVFIGLPVSEAENSLIVPLNGHELGHSIWNNSNLDDIYQTKLLDYFNKTKSVNFDNSEVRNIIKIALIKCVEYFCDFIGIGLFGESYLYAFTYLIAPKISKFLIPSHPNANNRATAMVKASEKFGCRIPNNFNTLFKTQLGEVKTRLEQSLEESERLSFNLVDSLIEDVKILLTKKNVLYTKSPMFTQIESELLSIAPIRSAESLADITNASWEVYFSNDKWNEIHKTEEEKTEILNELTIKSFEILEYKQRLAKK